MDFAAARTRTLEILEQLVAVPSLSGQAQDEMIACLQSIVAPWGITCDRVPSGVPSVSDGLLISVGPEQPGGLVLSGHMDVVAVEGQSWTSDPFRLRVSDARAYGRGTCDMKGFVACALTTLITAAQRGTDRPVMLVLSSDEESSVRSAPALVKALKTRSAPRGVIVGEPTGVHPCDREKASATFEITIRGRAAHASVAPDGVNAISLASQLIAWLDAETRHSAQRARPAMGFAPDHSLHSVTTIKGGVAGNTVPDRCVFQWDARVMPDEELEAITARFDAHARALCAQSEYGNAQIVRKSEALLPGLSPGAQSLFAKELAAVARTETFKPVPFGSEAGFFQKAGYETYICGPGDIAQAHKADEFIEVSELERCLTVLDALI